MRPVSSALIAAMMSCLVTAQAKPAYAPPSCAHRHTIGRRVVSHLDIVEFSVPYFAHVTKVRDVDYIEYYVRYGPQEDMIWLRFMFGVHTGGSSPDDIGNMSIRWTTQKWGCYQDIDGTDWRGRRQMAVAGDMYQYRLVSPFRRI